MAFANEPRINRRQNLGAFTSFQTSAGSTRLLKCLAALTLFGGCTLFAEAILSAAPFRQSHRPESLFAATEIAATFFFSLYGSRIALSFSVNRGFTRAASLQVVCLAGLLTANGGGTLRDLLASGAPVFWIAAPVYILAALLGTAAAFGFRLGPARRRGGLSQHIDLISTGVFVCLGVDTAIAFSDGSGVHLLIPIAVLSALATGLGGGMLRDTLIFKTRPRVLQCRLPMICVGAASIYCALMQVLPQSGAAHLLAWIAASALILAIHEFGPALRSNEKLPIRDGDVPISEKNAPI